jgi:hypothetical protein
MIMVIISSWDDGVMVVPHQNPAFRGFHCEVGKVLGKTTLWTESETPESTKAHDNGSSTPL